MFSIKFKKQKNSIINKYTIFCMIIIMVSCRHTKQQKNTSTTTTISTTTTTPTTTAIVKDVKAQAILGKIKANELNFKEMSAKMKTKVNSSLLNQSFTTNIRWKKGEKIWLSMSIIGIEGVRVLITKDSIKIMDRLNSRYILKPLSYIQEKAMVNLSFDDIEKLLLGQALFIDTDKATYTENANNSTITSNAARFLTSIICEKQTNNIQSIFVKDKIYTQTIDATYSDYQQQLGKPFSMERVLKMKNNKDFFEMTAKFQNIEFKENLSYPFTIQSNYTIEK